jgi:ABC-2 type transport system permease protein
MNKTLLIFKHEFITTLRKTSFIIMTLALPVLALLAIGISFIITGVNKPAAVEVTNIGYVDQAGGFNQYTTQGNIKLTPYSNQEDATRAMAGGNIKEYFIIPADYTSMGVVYRYTLEKQPAAPQDVMTAIKNFLTSNLLSEKMAPSTVSVIESPLNLVSIRITSTGAIAPEQGGYGNLIIPGIFSLLLALSLTFSSTYLLQGLGEEKENRLIEVLLSSVSVRQLLTGKVLGLGAAGLIQVLVWLVSAPLLLHLTSSTFGGFFSTIQLPANFILLGVVYFILGYTLFAVLSAGAGAISPSAREGQQIASIYTLIAISPLWFSSAIIAFPNSPVWAALTIFPLTAPVVVMLRLGLTDIPVWQIAVSIIVMIVVTIGLLLAAIRIFRVYLLMFGKRPRLGDVVRSLRSS